MPLQLGLGHALSKCCLICLSFHFSFHETWQQHWLHNMLWLGLFSICPLQHCWLPFHTMTSQRLVAFVVESIHYWILSRLSFEEVGGKPIQGARVILLQTLPDWPSHLLFSRDFLLSSFQRCVTIFCTYPRKHPLLTLSRSGPSCISLKTMTKTFPPFRLIVPKILDSITLTQKAGFRNENCSCRNCDLWAFGRTLLFSCHQCTSTSAKSRQEWSSNQTQSEPLILNRTVQCASSLNWIKLAAVRLRNKSCSSLKLWLMGFRLHPPVSVEVQVQKCKVRQGVAGPWYQTISTVTHREMHLVYWRKTKMSG